MYENAFNRIDNLLRSDHGPSSELDYVEQTSWVLFLRYLDDLEAERADEAELAGRRYKRIVDGAYRWSRWAAPKDKAGAILRNQALTGDDLIAFVEQKLFPALAGLKKSATGPDTIEYKVGEIFGELRNRFRSGYVLRDVVEVVDGLSFGTSAEKHELSDLYEARIKRMGNAGRNGGEYYTPRPLIRAIIKVVDPRIGDTVYDGACGSAGFLCEAYDHLRKPNMGAADFFMLQNNTLFGQEKKSLAYIIGVMNMVLHGVDAPNIRHTNTLAQNTNDISEGDRHDVVLANPPFGGGERPEVQHNFRITSAETAYLFLQHFIGKLKAGGRAGIVIKNTFLTNTDGASVALRRELLDRCRLHTVLDLPSGTFQGAGVKTVVLFFEKGTKTRDVWFYQLAPGRNLGKTNALNDADLAEFVALQGTRVTGPNSWTLKRGDLDGATLDLGVRNPHAFEVDAERTPEEIIGAMLARDTETAAILEGIRGML